jgi:hypothetical protein
MQQDGGGLSIATAKLSQGNDVPLRAEPPRMAMDQTYRSRDQGLLGYWVDKAQRGITLKVHSNS